MNILKNTFILFLLLLISEINTGQKLSPYAEISILTCAPGNELYSTFGHSAIRIKDPVLRLDEVYNYGTFNFETPGFYTKFIRGKLDYMLSVSPYRYFIIPYKQNKRAIKEQQLNLSYNQKNKIFEALKINALPENKYYRYDFLKDNCATRVLKVFEDILKDSLLLPSSPDYNNLTYREMLMPYLQGKDWERFGINLALGRPVDKIVTIKESAFLPDYLEKLISETKIISGKEEVNFVKNEINIYTPADKIAEKSLPYTPSRVFWILLLAVLSLTIFEIKYGKYFLTLDKTIFFVFGFTGLNILFLWFATEHSSVINNQNIIWASPLFFISAFLLRKNNKKYLKNFFLAYTGIIILVFLSDIFFIPLYDKAVIPLELILITRSSLIFMRK